LGKICDSQGTHKPIKSLGSVRFKGVVDYELMLLFEHKQHLQSYNAQSSMQSEIFYFKEFAV